MRADPEPSGPGLNEALAAWAAIGVVAALVWITYARLPAIDFYNVTGTGFWSGASRVLVLLGWPMSIAAVALTAVAADRLLASAPPPRMRRVTIAAAVAATVLCATIAGPGVIDEADLDAKPVNALAAVGVVIALLLTLAAARRSGVGRFARDRPGDSAAIVFIAVLLVAGIPWLLANVGVYAGDIPGLDTIFMSKQILPEPGHPTLHAVHLGNHEGLDGILLAAIALGLRRVLPELRPTRLRGVLGGYLALMLAYGTLVALNDGWNEQIVKRGWTDVGTPKVLNPAPNPSTALLVAITAVLYLAAFRVRPSPVE
ncbi:MAG TPA: hypothetical protein VFI18_12685 [Gaiellales bacterium]|nr:hypothetical protein [Gaiellales bacterium]